MLSLRIISRYNLLLIGILAMSHSFGQVVDPHQNTIAQSFMADLFKQDFGACWNLFDKANGKDVTREQFIAGMKTIYDSALRHYDGSELKTSGIKMYDNGKKLTVYSFRLTSSTEKIVDETLIDISFYDSSLYVAGVDYKWLIKGTAAKTSQGNEVSISGPFLAMVEGNNYKIIGINLVYFENNQALLAIQVETNLPFTEPDIQSWAKKEGVKFARYAFRNGYLDSAKKQAQEIHRTLLENIGVSFYQSNIGKGCNVMIAPEQYK